VKDTEREILETMKRLLSFLQERGIGLSKKGKEKLIRKFPSLEQDIQNIEDTGDPLLDQKAKKVFGPRQR
jgi:hypothetical protein